MKIKPILKGLAGLLGWGAINGGLGALLGATGSGLLYLPGLHHSANKEHHPADAALVGVVGHGALSMLAMTYYLLQTQDVNFNRSDARMLLGSSPLNPIVDIAGAAVGYAILLETDLITESLSTLLEDFGVGYALSMVGVLALTCLILLCYCTGMCAKESFQALYDSIRASNLFASSARSENLNSRYIVEILEEKRNLQPAILDLLVDHEIQIHADPTEVVDLPQAPSISPRSLSTHSEPEIDREDFQVINNIRRANSLP